MNDACSGRGCLAIGIYMGHYIVPNFLFTLSGTGKVNICNVFLQFGNLLFCNGQTQSTLCLC